MLYMGVQELFNSYISGYNASQLRYNIVDSTKFYPIFHVGDGSICTLCDICVYLRLDYSGRTHEKVRDHFIQSRRNAMVRHFM